MFWQNHRVHVSSTSEICLLRKIVIKIIQTPEATFVFDISNQTSIAEFYIVIIVGPATTSESAELSVMVKKT